jgi:hypothetical protein
MLRLPTIRLIDHAKGPQAYATELSNDLIGWWTNKQDAVITSTTKAEILVVSQVERNHYTTESRIDSRPRRSPHPNAKCQCHVSPITISSANVESRVVTLPTFFPLGFLEV